MKYVWQIEMFKDKKWIIELRCYFAKKYITDFDLHPIEGKRKNAVELTN